MHVVIENTRYFIHLAYGNIVKSHIIAILIHAHYKIVCMFCFSTCKTDISQSLVKPGALAACAWFLRIALSANVGIIIITGQTVN